MATCNWTHFDSVQDFAAECKALDLHDRGSWAGESIDETYRKVAHGDTSAVAEAERILDSIDSGLDMSGLKVQWQLAPVGAFPNVPACLAGAPDCMWRKQEAMSPRGEVDMVYCLCCSAAINAADAFRRNVAILAAAMAIGRVRPVNLKFVTSYGRGDHTIRVRGNPMVLSEAAYLATSPGFMRNLSFGWSRKKGWDGNWARWLGDPTNNERMDRAFRAELGLGEDDIVIPAMHVDRSKDILADPVKYINGLLDRYRG